MDEEPSLRLGILNLSVSGRQFPDAQDFWDANWLSVEASCETQNAKVQWRGPFLRNTELNDFREQLLALRSGNSAIAKLAALEPTLQVVVRPAKTDAATGHFSIHVEIADDLRSEVHLFESAVDQSELKRAAEQISAVLREFPVKG